ncbi:TPA: hypothetical protein N0F65_008124 [Lagenidium giganteum]|uniref:ATP adenylyltransferase n=1 Tax=Lagenidium giganteum TaxID=4803 RepID=A0AAV2YX59_9STRA|nr:TPA: hypothetical protein N0F65_008124 [Lagenidium giganteum]
MMRQKVLQVTERATATQALKRITAGHQLIKGDDGITYVVFAAQPRNRKPEAVKPDTTTEPKVFRDPFAQEHLEQDLFVAQLHDTHNVVLNKFNVVDEHVVLPTIELEQQETPLTTADLKAMWTAMEQLDAFAFFNCGDESGASQPHKHMQLISYPSMESYTGQRMPPLLQFIHDLLQRQPPSAGIVQLPEIPFFHLLHRISLPSDVPIDECAEKLQAIYQQMLNEMNLSSYARDAPVAYNLLLTSSFLFMIPRKCQAYLGMEVNSIGFIGSFLTRNEEQLAFLKTTGPMELLRQVTFPPLK